MPAERATGALCLTRVHVHEVRSLRVFGGCLKQRPTCLLQNTAIMRAHGRALTTAGCGVRAFGFSSSDSPLSYRPRRCC